MKAKNILIAITFMFFSWNFSFGKTINIPADYPTIKQGITAADSNDIINIQSGIYHENLIINKPLTLKGQDSSNTIIDGDSLDNVIKIISDSVYISYLQIKNSIRDYEGSGIPRDLRKDTPYLVYDQLDFNVITFNDCDVWSRYMVRIEEMKESAKLIRQILEKMPQGRVKLVEPKAVLPDKQDVYTKMEDLINDFILTNFGDSPEPGETYTAIEGPKGELGYFIVSDGTGNPWKLKIRATSSANLQGLATMAEGSMIADIVAIIGSIDPIMGEADK